MTAGVVVIGAGHAGFTVVDSLLRLGYQGPIRLVDAEQALPYQRPPLSKAYLAGAASKQDLQFRPESYYANSGIDLLLGRRLTSIDHACSRVRVDDSGWLSFDHLVLATGSRPRRWDVPGAGLPGVLRLHDRSDSDALREALTPGSRLVLVGGGFIGLEVASYAVKQGLEVTVVEATERLLKRSVSALTAEAIKRRHEAHGVRVLTGQSVVRVLGRDRAEGVELADGAILSADTVLVGIGSVPAVSESIPGVRTSLNGSLRVGRAMRTENPRVLACGDAVSVLLAERWVRLESVQNATDQARCVAKSIVSGTATYDAVPWFWTEQYGAKLQIAGLLDQADAWVVRGDIASEHWSVFGFRAGGLVGSESYARAGDHMATRALLANGIGLTPEQASDLDFDLRAHAAGRERVSRCAAEQARNNA